MKVTKKNLGIFLIAYPVPLLVINLALYAVLTFILASVASSAENPDLWILVGTIVKVLLSLIGLLGVFGILFGIPAGIILLIVSYHQDKPKTKS